ncbi:hypothetical protein [Bacteroides sp.]|uniref:hypothetical protein n=1 Tax=Bacteroides sp. TaxID=29523 RepID=UPI0026340E73|nr:hypothetical protein [Bacteroides sp.]MDD3037917.1 hypothetical protein [Bacteroides sp.]
MPKNDSSSNINPIPRIDCKKFARCGDKSLSYCRRYRGKSEACAGCTLIKRKAKNRTVVGGKEMKLCTHCGRALPLNRFYYQHSQRGGKTYYFYSSWCRMCTSENNNTRQQRNKSTQYERNML